MDTEKVIQADMLDIIFEGRNKAYGAYLLRKEYEKNIKKAMMYGSVGIFLAIAAPLVAKFVSNAVPKEDTGVVVDLSKGIKIEEPKAPPLPPPPPPPTPPPVRAVVGYSVPEPKPDDTVENEVPPIPPADSSIAIVGMTTVNGTDDLTPPPPPPPLGGDDDEREKTPEVKPEEIFRVVEEIPTFGDGTRDAPLKYFLSNIKYPSIARENHIEGRVVLTFVVETDGSVSTPQLLKDIGGECGEETLRVLKAMPKWKPGKQRGKPVRVQYTLPVQFKLAE